VKSERAERSVVGGAIGVDAEVCAEVGAAEGLDEVEFLDVPVASGFEGLEL
jgi:hypothetical protein